MGDLVSNRRALHDYAILEVYEAGIVLFGTEIKSLRDHGGSLQDAYVDIRHHALWLLNAYIAPYLFGSIHNHPEKRERKLLLHHRELNALIKRKNEKGCTLIPLSIYLNQRGLANVKIAAAKGKKTYDKRETIKAREDRRAIERAAREGR